MEDQKGIQKSCTRESTARQGPDTCTHPARGDFFVRRIQASILAQASNTYHRPSQGQSPSGSIGGTLCQHSNGIARDLHPLPCLALPYGAHLYAPIHFSDPGLSIYPIPPPVKEERGPGGRESDLRRCRRKGFPLFVEMRRTYAALERLHLQ